LLSSSTPSAVSTAATCRFLSIHPHHNLGGLAAGLTASLRCLIAVAVESLAGLRSNCLSEFIEGRCDAELRWSIGGEFVVAAADVLEDSMHLTAGAATHSPALVTPTRSHPHRHPQRSRPDLRPRGFAPRVDLATALAATTIRTKPAHRPASACSRRETRIKASNNDA
jgi:hypothetical protein